MKLIIAGSRGVVPTMDQIDAAFDDLVFVIGDVTEVVSGKAPGVDLAGEEWARYQFDRSGQRIKITEFHVTDEDRRAFGPRLAPKHRNRRMAQYADGALIFWDGISGGSSDMATRMLARDLPVRVIPTRPARSR